MTSSKQYVWHRLMRPGDWLVILGCAVFTAFLIPSLFKNGVPERAVVKRDGQIVAELSLTESKRIEVAGPMGKTVIEIEPGRARVASDPGLRQYCVRQGWLSQANAVAICAPNHVSLMLLGRASAYDTLSY